MTIRSPLSAPAGPSLKFLRPVPLVVVTLFSIAAIHARQYYLLTLSVLGYAAVLAAHSVISRGWAKYVVSWTLLLAIMSLGLYLLQ